MKFPISNLLFRTAGLTGFWALLSGKFEFQYLFIGLICSLAVAYASLQNAPKNLKAPHILSFAGKAWRFMFYCLWLLLRIISAAWHVSKIVISPKLSITPKMITHKTKLKSELERVIFANSITLTPGTITAELASDELLIHQIDENSSEDIRSGSMENAIGRIKL